MGHEPSENGREPLFPSWFPSPMDWWRDPTMYDLFRFIAPCCLIASILLLVTSIVFSAFLYWALRSI